MKKVLLFIAFISLSILSFSQTKEVPFTLDDRDRIIKMEAKLESLSTEMESKFDSVNQRIDTIYWGFGILIVLMLFLLGYIIWDRRTALGPIQSKTYDLGEKYFKLESALKEQAKHDPKLAEILKSFGLL